MRHGQGLLLVLAFTLAGCDQVASRLASDMGLSKRESPRPEAGRDPDKGKATKGKAPTASRPAQAPAAPGPTRQAAPRETPPKSPPPPRESKQTSRPVADTGPGGRDSSTRSGSGAGAGAAPETGTGAARPSREVQSPPPRVRPVPVYIED